MTLRVPRGMPHHRLQLLCLVAVFCHFVAVNSAVIDDDDALNEYSPRFKSNAVLEHPRYLGDRAKLRCFAVGRPPPVVHWFHGGERIRFDRLSPNDADRLKENARHMSLEIKRIQVEDKGNWSCVVFNKNGNITRPFRIEVLDLCDFYLNAAAVKTHDVPMECVCFWKFTGESQLRTDIDFSVANLTTCRAYGKSIRYYARKPFTTLPCFDPPCTDEERSDAPASRTVREEPPRHHDVMMPGPPPPPRMPPPVAVLSVPSSVVDKPQHQPMLDPVAFLDIVSTNGMELLASYYRSLFSGESRAQILRSIKDWKQLSQEERRKRAILFVVKHSKITAELERQEEENDEAEISEEERWKSKVIPRNQLVLNHARGPRREVAVEETKNPTLVAYEDPKSLTPIRNLTETEKEKQKKPYFKYDSETDKSIFSPAGRTIRLSCPVDGVPTPQIAWHKRNKLIDAQTERITGGEYRIRPNSLEIEDATESDSDIYMCEAFNSKGTIRRRFNVSIINRMRSVPLIVPNILLNQTVNVNETALFRCKVISDLLPHIMWVRIDRGPDGNYFFFNTTAEEYVLNYRDIEGENARVIANGDESTLELRDVQLSDQGLYACISGNALGKVMANATLTVNEFEAVKIPTGHERPRPSFWMISIYVGFFSVLACLCCLVAAALLIVRQQKKRAASLQHQALLPKKKLVIVSRKRPPPENGEEGWADLPSSYQIQIIEKDADGEGKVVTGSYRRHRLNSDLTASAFSDVEVESDPDWEIDRGRLALGEVLGEGAFGEVWKGSMRTGDEEQPVAVKKLKSTAHHKELIDLVSEAQMFKLIGKHDNVLRLIGCCTGKGPLYVVLELCAHGNLRDFLRAHRPSEEKESHPIKQDDDYLCPRKSFQRSIIPNLTQRHLVEFAWQVARGMQYVSSRKIIHRDLAARNVLVTQDFVMKISDFGLSRDVQSADYYRKKGNGRLPIKWMAIEALDSHIYTVESDVWSYGILLWEIMTLGGTPYPTIAMPNLFSYLREGYRMEAPHNCPDEIYHLMVGCWQERREKRPTFDMIVNYLDWMLAETEKANDTNDEETTVQSGSSGDLSGSNSASSSGGDGSLSRKRKLRPLSAPVLLPSEPAPHDICDDDDGDDELTSGDEHHAGGGRNSRGPVGMVRQVMGGPPLRSPTPPLPPLSPPRTDSPALTGSNTTAGGGINNQEGPDSAIGSPSALDIANDYSVPFLDECRAPDGGVVAHTHPHHHRDVEYVNILGPAASAAAGAGAAVSKAPRCRFAFPPPTTRPLLDEMDAGAEAGLIFISSPLQDGTRRRSSYSIGSASSGRGGSSATSSAEGLGDFCQKVDLRQRPAYSSAELKRQAASLDESCTAVLII